MRISLIESPLLADFTPKEREILSDYFEARALPPRTLVVREGDDSDAIYVILEGEARIQRGGVVLSTLTPGDCFGELGLISKRPRAATVRSVEALDVALMTQGEADRLAREHPALAQMLLRAFISRLGEVMGDLTNTIASLLKERARPLRTHVTARLPGGEIREVPAATPLYDLLPKSIDGVPVVAALLNGKPRALSQPLYSSAEIAPVTLKARVGRTTYRLSMSLLMLEAANQLDPTLDIRVGPSVGFAYLVEVRQPVDLSVLAKQLTREMRALIDKDLPLRRERWTVEEAREQFIKQGWQDAADQLRLWRSSTVPLFSCGDLYAIEVSPIVPSTGHLAAFELLTHNGDLLLAFGDDEKRHKKLHVERPTQLARAHFSWLNALGVTSVSAFNQRCIQGDVPEIIRVSEGFHEKRISQIADAIAESGARVICVSGPSSSGKTTSLKRLSVQLQVNGLTPRGISLDDYYVDRELTVRDEHGEYDFEAFEALNIELMGEHIRRLIAGETVRTAHYDFKSGRSHPEGGPEITLKEGHVLLLEGIHALNPRLPVPDQGVFRVFINAMTSLALDHVNRVSVSDIRLLRRIVRDRHQRAITAADNIARWPSVRRGEREHIFPHQHRADAEFNSSLLYEPAVLKVYAERYLLEVPEDHPAHTTAYRLRRLLDKFVAIYPDHVGPTSILREFIGGLTF
ncbi:cyclic nucleotide-binding domain-containing protein [Myxococcota bacterium]|nr:cyclic nucleotide-binding domain-containing protein [Myxococcota bacterium]MBU1429260.1 cyclic nucleotide-binding domain-containing protein [Myxococcota bacterium]MBU1896538.1 cyclic nucleotide-binding domain-containing protein [Myxococcota bacterium]